MNFSIRRYLLKYLTVALLAASLAIGFFTYLIAGKELDELHDKNMQQVAQALLAQHQTISTYVRLRNSDKRLKLHGEEEFLIQIWKDKDTLIYASHPSIHFPHQSTLGYGNTQFNHQEWRYYMISGEGISVQLAQTLDQRHEAIVEMSSNFLIPLLLQVPLLGFLIWAAVGKSLRPLEVVSCAIEERGSHAMHPLTTEALPLEIKPLVLALNDLLVRLDLALKAQRRFVADAAHELRTPLTAVQLQLDVLKRSRSDEERQEGLKKLANGIKRSIHVVRQLLSMAHQDPEIKEQKKELFDLALLARDAMVQCEPLAHQKNILLTFTGTPSGITFTGNKYSLYILTENLLDNAIRYTPEGGKITIHVSEEAGNITLRVSDNGNGIPASERERVFDRFYRITGTEQSGSGLGLAIVKRIAEQHHATIQLEEGLEGTGVSFCVTFPASLSLG